MEETTAHAIRGTLILISALLLCGVVAWWSFRRSVDQARWVMRIGLSVVILGAMVYTTKAGMGGITEIFSLLAGCVFALMLAILWGPSIIGLFAKPLGEMFTGSDEPPDPEPLYSVAMARRQQGLFQAAIHEVQMQLQQFPQDVTGQMLLAEIQAENLRDLALAEITILRLCNQPGHPPATIALALASLADWQLSVAHDIEAARQAMEQIIERFPDTEFAMQARQRIAHLPTAEMLDEKQHGKTVTLTPWVKDMGLRKVAIAAEDVVKSKEPNEAAAEWVAHLTEHPADTDARERLARLYAEELDRLDLAVEQMEALIHCEHLPVKQVAHYYHVLADMQVRVGRNLEAAKAALQRLIERFPNTAHAVQAETRKSTLANELPRPEHDPIKLGTYDNRMGLKQKTRSP
ncbi:MAG: outer membrane protein assembly factor BamD [Verrucomicrobiota bacterium]